MRIDHLNRKDKESDVSWQQPKVDDVQKVYLAQIIPCKVQGIWDYSEEIPVYVLQNSENINKSYQEHFFD